MRPVAAGVVAAFVGAAFLAAADFVVLMAVPGRLMAEAAFAPVAREAVVFLTTVDVLPSLPSLVVLTFRLPRVVVGAAVELDVAVATLRPRAAVGAALAVLGFELVDDDVVVFLLPVAALRMPFAFSTIFERRFDEDLYDSDLTGEAGLLSNDLVGDAGLSRPSITRVFDDAGDSIW